MKATFHVHGSYGILTACAVTGQVLHYDQEEGTTPDESYSDIILFDVDEWRKTYPGETLEGCSNDILDMSFFYWDTKTGEAKYEEAEKDWRADYRTASNITAALPSPFTLVSQPPKIAYLPHPGHTPAWKKEDRLCRGRCLLILLTISALFWALMILYIFS